MAQAKKVDTAYLKSYGIEKLLKEKFGDVNLRGVEVRDGVNPTYSVSKFEILNGHRIIGYYYEIAQVIDFDREVFSKKKLPEYLNLNITGRIIPEAYRGGGRELAFVELLESS